MIKFNDTPITRQQFVDAVLFFKDVTYHVEDTNVKIIEEIPVGTANCFGIFILALQRLGITDLDPNLPWTVHKRSRAAVLVDILETNFDPLPLARENIQIGDLMMFRWKDQNHRLKTIHHVGGVVDKPVDEPYGMMIHALDRQSGGLDKINIHRISQLDWDRLEQIWSLKNFTD